MIIRMVKKGAREYILRSEREGYWENRIKDLEKELADINPADFEEVQAKKKEIELVTSSAKTNKEKLAKHGATVWMIENVSKKAVLLSTASSRLSLGDDKSINQRVLTSGQLAYVELQRLNAFEMGIRGWKNLIDQNGEEIPFDKSIIDLLSKEIMLELGSEIMGELSDEESKN